MNLREKLINLRIEKNLTQANLADELGISISSIKKYENEKEPRRPETYILDKYSKFFKVSMDYLIDDKIENKTSENINISKILNLSDTAIYNLKKYNHKAIDLLIESEQLSTFNNLLDLYFKFSNLINKTEQVKIKDEPTIDELAHNINEIMKIYHSYRQQNNLITTYTITIENIDGFYLQVLEDNRDFVTLADLKEEFSDIYITFVKSIKIIKLELIEEFSKFLNTTSIS